MQISDRTMVIAKNQNLPCMLHHDEIEVFWIGRDFHSSIRESPDLNRTYLVGEDLVGAAVQIDLIPTQGYTGR
jgi:hypothetical protein